MTGAEPGKAPVPVVTPGRNDQGVITAESAASAYGNDMKRSGGIFGTMDRAGQNERMAKSLGYAGVDDFNKQFAQKYSPDAPPPGGWGAAILGQGTVDQTERENAEKTQRWRNDELIKRASRGNQGAVIEAMRANADPARIAATVRDQDLKATAADQRNQVDMRGQDVRLQGDLARAAKDPLEQRLKGLQLGDAEQISALRGIAMNAKPPEERDAALKKLTALSGKNSEDKPWAHVVGGGVDPNTGQMKPQYIVTGRGDKATTASTGEDLMKRQQPIKPLPNGYTKEKLIAEAKSSGKDPAAIAARLAEYGIQYGT